MTTYSRDATTRRPQLTPHLFGRFRGALLVILILLAPFARVASAQTAPDDGEAIVGTWYSEEGKMQVALYRCGDAFCGRIVGHGDPEQDEDSQESERPDDLVGREILSELVYEGGGVWGDGRMYVPKLGTHANATFTRVAPDTLQVKVSRFIFRRTIAWRRVGH